METLSDILRKLQAPIPPHLVSKKPIFEKRQKVGEVDYISWVNYCDLLDERCGLGNWDWNLTDLTQTGNRLVLVGCLTIQGTDKTLTMRAIGEEDLDVIGYGSPGTNAESQSMRRCAAKFGLGRDLWRKKGTSKPASPTLPNIRQPRRIQQSGSKTISREEWLRRKQSKQLVD